jgi:hypothetical protein
MVFFAMQH